MGAVTCSAKSGLGVEDVLEEIVAKIPAPQGDAAAPLQAVIIDSWFDNYVGVVMLIRIKNGSLKLKDKVRFMSTKAESQVEQLGVFTPKSVQKQELTAGEVGFLITGVKELGQAKVGDTVTLAANPAAEPLAGFKEVQSQVFAGLYPVESHDYEALRDALEKLQLNDASLKFEPEVSQALGFGFRCGFLGLLHLEIVQERLEREFDMDLITTAPTVVYEVVLKNGEKNRRGKPVQTARHRHHRNHYGADYHRHHPRAAGLCGQRDDPVQPKTRRAAQYAVPRAAGDAHLRFADERSRYGLFDKLNPLRTAMHRWITSLKSSSRPIW